MEMRCERQAMVRDCAGATAGGLGRIGVVEKQLHFFLLGNSIFVTGRTEVLYICISLWQK